ncbi:MAG: hypothetical protein PHP98_06835 [Kiritimatiellae bacterium]|jgi:hypothetical protein|nr:hypothetical protein [Kiritimatiellia bacterium]
MRSNELLNIEGALYPDQNPPASLKALADRVDFLARMCAAWDFGILPDEKVVREITTPGWRKAVEACELLTSPSYHLLREWQGLPSKPFLGQTSPEIVNDPNLVHV